MTPPSMTWIVQNLWLIPALPFLAAGFGALLRQRSRMPAASLAIGSMALSFLLSLCAFAHALAHPAIQVFNFRWFQFGDQWLQLGWVLDPLTAVMLVMVTFVGLLIFIYSIGYMEHDENFTRFFCFLALFAGAMLGVIIANSLLLLFMCWEIVGLTSYLLIGFWYAKPEAAAAAKKAFITTRIGDLGFLIGMVWLYAQSGTLLFYNSGLGCLETAALSHLARRRPSRPHRRLRHRHPHLLRRGRQIRPGPAPRLAARRHGRPHPRQRPHPRRHHGRRRRLPHRPHLSPDVRHAIARDSSPPPSPSRSSPGSEPSPPSSPPPSPSRNTTSSASSPTPPSPNSAT